MGSSVGEGEHFSRGGVVSLFFGSTDASCWFSEWELGGSLFPRVGDGDEQWPDIPSNQAIDLLAFAAQRQSLFFFWNSMFFTSNTLV